MTASGGKHAAKNDLERAEAVIENRYRLVRPIGRGATAEVFEADDTMTGRRVAVKIFDRNPIDPVQVGRLRREMRLMSSLSHPHLVRLYDARIADPVIPERRSARRRTYLILEFVDGDSLVHRLRGGPVEPAHIAGWGRMLADALSDLHRAGLVHGDLKPANVLFAQGDQVKLADSGLAGATESQGLPRSDTDVPAILAYISPEQAAGAFVDSATDVYSLGLILLECLTGHREFAGDPLTSAMARLLRRPVIPETLSEPWQLLLTAMTSTDPQQRPSILTVARLLAEPGSVEMLLRPVGGAVTAVRSERPAVAVSVAPELDVPSETLDPPKSQWPFNSRVELALQRARRGLRRSVNERAD